MVRNIVHCKDEMLPGFQGRANTVRLRVASDTREQTIAVRWSDMRAAAAPELGRHHHYCPADLGQHGEASFERDLNICCQVMAAIMSSCLNSASMFLP